MSTEQVSEITEPIDQIELDESVENIDTPIPTSNPEPKPEEIKELIKELELKVNGKVIKEKIDLNDEKRLVKELQMSRAAQEAFQKAAAKEKELSQMNEQLDQFFKLLQENPLSILLNPELGLNAEEIANKILDKKIEEESKSPEQKKLEEAMAKLERYEKEKQEAEQAAEKARMDKLAAEVEAEIESSINNAIDKGDLPKSPYILSKFGQLMEIALDNGIDVNAEELIPIVKNSYMKDMREMLGKLPDDLIEEMVTPERVKNIRTKRLSALKEANKKAEKPKIEDLGAEKQTESSKTRKKDPNFWKKLGTF